MKSLGTRRGERDTYLLPSSLSSKSDRERANEIVNPKVSLSKSQIDALGIADCDVGEEYEAKIRFEVIGVEKGDTSTYGDSVSVKKPKLSMTIALVGCEPAVEVGEDDETEVEEPAEIKIEDAPKKPKPSRVSAQEAGMED